MARLTLAEIARLTGGRILAGAPETAFDRFGIDSREALPGSLFFAENGASGAVVSRSVSLADEKFGLVLVTDTLAALQDLAAAVLRERPVKVVGITGSIGKTTTKEFAAALLSPRFRVLKSTGNYNNHLGLPLSLLGLEGDHEIAILEMGMSGFGEIRALARIAPPDVAVITNVAPVHLKFFESLEDIARAKKEILDGAKKHATAVLNGDDPLVRKISEDWRGPRITFGLNGSSDVRARGLRPRGLEGTDFVLEIGREKADVTSPFLNSALVMNVLAAAAVAHVCGVPIAEMPARVAGLESFGRRGILSMVGGILLYDDTYNSNPKALERVLASLAGRFPSRKIAVLGDMLELGDREREFHREAGETVHRLGWDVLVAVGPLAAEMAAGAAAAGMDRESIFVFPDSSSAAGRIAGLVREGDLVPVKGSRGMTMEKIIERLKAEIKE
jgi:UDP-N-acetylmuramoyl-tripeptide--D-alanyl-D-alanine ligase